MIAVPPALVERPEVTYVAKPVVVTMDTIDGAIDDAVVEMERRLASLGIAPAGAPIVRYRVIDMARELLIEVGFPVAAALDVPEGLVCDSLPAGTYGALTYRDVTQGVAGNGALIDWAAESGIEWDRRDTDAGDAFASRVEVLLGDPDVDPDPTHWEAEVAILVKAL